MPFASSRRRYRDGADALSAAIGRPRQCDAEPRAGRASARAPATTTKRNDDVDMRLELVPLRSTDVDKSKAFYVDQVGFGLDHDVEPGNGMRVGTADASRILLLGGVRDGHR